MTIGGKFIGWQSVQTGGDVIDALKSTCLAVSTSNIVGIVGPGYSRESLVIAPFAKTIGIPVISYGSTDPELSDRNAYPAFYRTVPSDNSAALAMTDLFNQYNWTSCIIIYQNDDYGSGGAKAISDTFNNNNLIVTNTIIFDIITLRIRGDLQSLLTDSSIRIIILWAASNYASLVLQNALDNNLLGPQFTWILSTDTHFNQTSYNQLLGILIIKPVVGSVVNAPINKTLLDAAYDIWQEYEPESYPGSNNVDYYALFAFDATWTLIQSLQKFYSITRNNSLSFFNTSFCFDRYLLNSNSFYNIINQNSFLGVSGLIQFSINVTDRVSGIYYILENTQSSSNVPVLVWSNGWTSLNTIVWPGNSSVPPSGYASVSGLNLRIAVTETAPFTLLQQFIDDSGQTRTKLIGYVPDLIEILREKMGFIPNITLIINQTFDEMVNSVANNVYDMFIAQTIITAERSEIVDFSDSIFDNSLSVIIRKDSKVNINFFSYLRSFSLELWIILLLITIYAGVLIGLIEREENEILHDRSRISLIGLSLWYSIGTLVGYGVDFDEDSFGIVFQKNWLYQQEFDVNILSLRESGVLDDLRNQWFQTNFCSQSSDLSSTAMTIESMAGLFLTFGIISILALLLILWQRRFIIRDSLVTFAHRKNLRDLSTGKNPVEVSSMTYPTVYF